MKTTNKLAFVAAAVVIPVILDSTAYACAGSTHSTAPALVKHSPAPTKPCPAKPKPTTPPAATTTPTPPATTATPPPATTTVTASPAPAATPAAAVTASTQPTQLVNTGPGNVIGIFVAVSLAAAFVHATVSRKFARQ